MKKLLSLPPNVVDCFHDITGYSKEEFFCTSDPIGQKLGSGGGTAWILKQAYEHEKENPGNLAAFMPWLMKEKRIILHAGGRSQRLPSYALTGKILMPVPVFRWERGQKLSQDLLSLQLPLYEHIMAETPSTLNTMVVSGDVLIRATEKLPVVPTADVVCYGLWLDATVAKNHGVFVCRRDNPNVLKQMLQKPTVETLNMLQKDHLYMTDIGIWLLSDKAVNLLMKRSMDEQTGGMRQYDLYSEFGCCLGTEPTLDDEELNNLSVAIVPLTGGEFYHFGTSREMISSTLAIQNLVNDQRQIMHHDLKPHPSIFVQNSVTHYTFNADNRNIWIENSYVGEKWTLTQDNVVTGVPENDWEIRLEPGECIDVVPIGNEDYQVRRYHIDERVDSDMLSTRVNLERLWRQRCNYRQENWKALAKNWEHSVFYQLDLDDAARQFKDYGIPMPPPLPETAPLQTRISDAMFRGDSQQAFGLLREGLMVRDNPQPKVRGPYSDQIIWARSPVRIDIAGGWTDTPPYCLMEGGNVVNIAIELNGQPPLQAFIKPCKEQHVILRSIDLGASERIDSYEQLSEYNKVGSPFSIPKAALVLAGFSPSSGYPSLQAQLSDFGCGIELTLLSAVPAGSGLGTSSILAATVLGALNDFCSLAWDKNEICHQTLLLEQLLTTGGGWQDQFGGVLGGVKLLQTEPGMEQLPTVRWLPDMVFTSPEYAACHLLYYTGITRTAKTILAEIVRRMFLNQHEQLLLLRDMKAHTLDMYETIMRNDFARMGTLIRKTWQQNQQLDSGTNPDCVKAITSLVDDLCLGYKLPGAGGGGYLYMVAKDPEAAARIKQTLNEHQPNRNARFVEMTLSQKGLQVSRS